MPTNIRREIERELEHLRRELPSRVMRWVTEGVRLGLLVQQRDASGKFAQGLQLTK